MLLVGAGSGLGRGVVRACRQHGAQLAVLEVSAAKVQSLEAELGPDALVMQGDATRSSDLVKCRDAIVERYGKLDAAFCFQGIFDGNVPLKTIDLDRVDQLFDELFHINVKSCLLTARVFHDLLEKSRGALVLTSSNAAYAADGGGSFYTATKGAISALVRQLAFEFHPAIRVNAVAPGGIGNSELRGPQSLDMQDVKQSDIPKDVFLEMVKRLSLTQELPDPEDYGWLYAFLGSHANRVMTGQIVLAEQGLLNRRLLS